MTIAPRLHGRTPATLLAVALLASAGAPLQAQSNAEPEEFTAFAVSMGLLAPGASGNVVITINRWNSVAEREKLFTLAREKGADAMLDELRRLPRIGTIRAPGNIGYELYLAFQDKAEEGGRRVMVITDRPIPFAEARNRPPWYDYPFMVIELMLRPDGTGKGTLSTPAKIVPLAKTILVENWDTQPIQLNQVEARKLK